MSLTFPLSKQDDPDSEALTFRLYSHLVSLLHKLSCHPHEQYPQAQLPSFLYSGKGHLLSLYGARSLLYSLRVILKSARIG